MKLYEFEGKELFKKYNIPVPKSKLYSNKDTLNFPDFAGFAVKAQVTAGKRGVSGGVALIDDKSEALKAAQDLFGKKIQGFPVNHVLVEEKHTLKKLFYLSVIYNTVTRNPTIAFSPNGGIDIEQMHDTHTFEVMQQYDSVSVKSWLQKLGLDPNLVDRIEFIAQNAFTCFMEEDLRILEINPLAVLENSTLLACDAKVMTDEDANYRHKERVFIPKNEFGREPTQREIDAKKIDEGDHRGIGGKYTELEGDIAMLTAGGGASLTNMDALLAYGGKPANYTEYSGNPPTEKVYKLTKVILSKPGLVGCWHVGGTANNTQLDVTMKGFAQALEEIKPEYPIVVRRDGPGKIEGFRILEDVRDRLNLNMKLFDKQTPMTESAQVLMELIAKYKNKKELK